MLVLGCRTCGNKIEHLEEAKKAAAKLNKDLSEVLNALFCRDCPNKPNYKKHLNDK